MNVQVGRGVATVLASDVQTEKELNRKRTERETGPETVEKITRIKSGTD